MECLNIWIYCWRIKCNPSFFFLLQLPPVQSKDSETRRPKLPSLLHSPTPHHHHLSGGLVSMGLSATVREQLRSKLQKVQLWSCDENLLFIDTFWNELCIFSFFLGASVLIPWHGAHCCSFLLIYRVNEDCLHLRRWASLD